METLTPNHNYFRLPDKAIIDPVELVIAEEKFLQFSQLESFAAECKQLAAAKTSRAIHIELVPSMDTSSCVMAI